MRFPRAARVFIAIPSFGFMNFRITRSSEEKKKRKRRARGALTERERKGGGGKEGRKHPVTPNITVPVVLPTSCGNVARDKGGGYAKVGRLGPAYRNLCLANFRCVENDAAIFINFRHPRRKKYDESNARLQRRPVAHARQPRD